MTDFERVKGYYQYFDEDQRLSNDNSGRLEYEMTMKKLLKNLPASGTILDLGGATGVYAFPLAEMGYRVYLADLSERLIQLAREKKEQRNTHNLISCDIVNAIDLSLYPDDQFDVVLLFGPLYHLLDAKERHQCVSEIRRVLKPDGMVFASFIPYLSGSIAIVDRYFRSPDQVGLENLREVFSSGRFNNNAQWGFQEGYYPTSDEIVELFEGHRFMTIQVSSIRGFAYEKEDQIDSIQDAGMLEEIKRLIEETSELKEIVEMCGHAMYIGRRKP
ncbi:MAG: class I SAM-dependent methyltransferase [Clostridiales bacterium]|nr:class I SAM-dependent methyltransferase [Clostridiales bacterium]